MLTNRCNLHCCHCDIWAQKSRRELSFSQIKKVLTSDAVGRNPDLAITGGEPFLHSGFFNIVKFLLHSRPLALKTVSTNGTVRSGLIKFLDTFQPLLPSDFALHISVDGINKHDIQRGRSLKLILDNISLIRRQFPGVNIKLKFTITPVNYADIIPTYDYAYSRNIGFKIKLVENACHYTNQYIKRTFRFSPRMKESIVKDLIAISLKAGHKEKLFIKSTIDYLNKDNARIYCATPFDRIFVAADAQVYSCLHFAPIGNISLQTLDEIWGSPRARSLRNRIQRSGCNKCVSFHGFNPTGGKERG